MMLRKILSVVPWWGWFFAALAAVSLHEYVAATSREAARAEEKHACNVRISGEKAAAGAAFKRRMAAVSARIEEQRALDQAAIEALEADNDALVSALSNTQGAGDVAWTAEMVEKMGGAR